MFCISAFQFTLRVSAAISVIGLMEGSATKDDQLIERFGCIFGFAGHESVGCEVDCPMAQTQKKNPELLRSGLLISER